MLILIFFFGLLVQKYIKKHIKHSDSPLLLKFFFSIFYRNAKIPTSFTAKSRSDGEKQMSNSDSAVKKNIENDHTHQLCISKKIFL